MTDRKTVLYVVAGVAIALLLAVIGIIVLAALERPIPDILATLAVAALTGLTALLARTSSSDEPAPVTVVNSPGDPVPTTDTAATPAPVAGGLDPMLLPLPPTDS